MKAHCLYYTPQQTFFWSKKKSNLLQNRSKIDKNRFEKKNCNRYRLIGTDKMRKLAQKTPFHNKTSAEQSIKKSSSIVKFEMTMEVILWHYALVLQQLQ